MKKRMCMIMLLLAMTVSLMAGCGTSKTAEEQKKAESVVDTKSETTEQKKTTEKAENKAAEKEDSETVEKKETAENGKAEEKKETADVAQKEADQKTETAKQDSTAKQETKNTVVKTETKTEKKQNTATTNTNNNTSSSTSTSSHTHNWVAQTKTVHHDEVGHNEPYVVTEAWDEEVPIYETVEINVCNVCNEEIIGSPAEHGKVHALAYEGSGHHSEWKEKQVGTDVVHHDAVYDTKWVVDQAAYDETVTTGGYKCSGCGATK